MFFIYSITKIMQRTFKTSASNFYCFFFCSIRRQSAIFRAYALEYLNVCISDNSRIARDLRIARDPRIAIDPRIARDPRIAINMRIASKLHNTKNILNPKTQHNPITDTSHIQ